MAGLHNKVKLYLEANGKTEAELFDMDKIILRNKGSGDFISLWNVSGLAKPTDEQLNSLESQADELETENQVISNRKSEYPSIEELVVALYDTDDKAAIEAKRAEVKAKYPK